MSIIINNPSSINAIADGAITTAKLADGAVTTAKLSTSLTNKNYFKNPAFAVVQGTSSGTLPNSLALPTASLGYPGETEWCIAAAGGTPTYAFSAANESVTFTGAASTTAIYLLQRLESLNTNRLKNKTVTFSCEISNSLLTSVIWEVFRPTTTDNVHGTIATPTQTLIASGTFTVNSTLTRYSATFALPDLTSRGLEVRLRVGTQTSGTWVVSRLQFEEGSTATNFNCGDFPIELQKCQRYYLSKTFFVGDIFKYTTDYTFPSPMFAAPVLIGGGAGFTLFLLNDFSFTVAQTPSGAQLLTFSAHIP
jgi:hypothetical protein